jgi:DNA polymerase elongation subunit (family B)
VYPPSKIDPLLPVSNRYFGKFSDGEIKMRGLFARRKDTPDFVKKFQMKLLEIMRKADTIQELKKLHSEMNKTFQEHKDKLESGKVVWKELLLRRTVGREMDEYEVENANFLSMEQLKKFHIQVEPGEKVKYIVLKEKHFNKTERYLTEEMAEYLFGSNISNYDSDYYVRQIWEAYKEIWENFAPKGYFRFTPSRQLYFDFINLGVP